MSTYVESILHSAENKNKNNNNESVWHNKVNVQNVEVEAAEEKEADKYEIVTKGNHFNRAYGNIVMTTKRRLNEEKMSRPIIQLPTKAATNNNDADKIIEVIMVPLPPELRDKLTIEDFNSRRRRGRLRLSISTMPMQIPLPLLLPLPLSYNKQKNITKKEKLVEVLNATKNILAAIEPDAATSKNFICHIANRLLSKLLLLLLLSSLILKNCVNKFINKLIILTAACASKLFAIYNNMHYNGKRRLKHNIYKLLRKLIYNKDHQQQQHYHNSYYKHSHNAGLVYAFILCTSILLPCNTNLATAFKPKSVQTQLQQQEQQQQQQHQGKHHQHTTTNDNNHNNKNLQPGSASDAYEILLPIPQDDDAEFLLSQSQEHLFDAEDDEHNSNLILDEDTHRNDTNVTIVHKTPLFPKDLFSKEQLENGAVIFHIIGVIYMFVALAIVCDEFFVPSLDVIIEKLDITDDVAGATFMAAGGSAPELFTSVIGVFVSFDDVGIGTIVGSAVFNILFVIGMCALFSKTVLTLTWWPLFRDCSFYSVSLLVLIYFFRDSLIWWWEAMILFFIYIAYVGFMKWNVQVEHCVKKVITKNKGNAANSSETSMATQPGGSVTSRATSESRFGPTGSSSACGTTGNNSGAASTTHTGAKFRHGLLQLMIHTIDPLHDDDDVPGKVDEKATQLHAIASLKVLLDATKPQRGSATTSAANHVKINLKETTLADRPNGNIDTTLDSPSLSGRRQSWIEQRVKIQTRKFSIKANEIEEVPEPLSMAWPDTARKRLTYILVAPLLVPMWLTLPDTRTPRGKKFFPVTFIGSILWIAAFSYLMVWWANVAGDTARIPPEVMGLTFLAAGTSIPDLITSVIVARKGFGDMAVSSSVGSNIFDVTVGLPVPWLLYGIIYGAPVEVNSQGMVCSITILFMMLIFVVMSIACFRWKMNKGLGLTMFLLYFVFVAVSLMFEYKIITCPV